VTESRVLLDTWAWWEILRGSPEGASLQRKYLEHAGTRVFTSSITLGEVSAKMASEGRRGDIVLVVASIRRESEIVDVTPEIAVSAGILRQELRKVDAKASLADAIVLSTARGLDAILVSADPAFRGQSDVRDH
jgi:predicted nucleic acid-binding protein